MPDKCIVTDKMLEEVDLVEEFQQKVNYFWENSEELGNKVKKWAHLIRPNEMKQKILKEYGLIQCQVHQGDYEQIVMERVAKAGQMAKAARRCREHEEVMGRKFDERMKKLTDILQSR